MADGSKARVVAALSKLLFSKDQPSYNVARYEIKNNKPSAHDNQAHQ